MIVSTDTLQHFYRDLASLLELHTSSVSALELIAGQSDSSALAKCCRQFIKDITQGDDLAEAFSAYPEIFPSRVIGMLRLGEQQGLLSEQSGLIASGYLNEYLGSESDSEYNDMALIFAQVALLIDKPVPAYSLSEAFKSCALIFDEWADKDFISSFSQVAECLARGDSLSRSMQFQAAFYPPPIRVLFELGDQVSDHQLQAFFSDLSRLLANDLIPGLREDLPADDGNLRILLAQYLESLKFLLSYGASLRGAIDYICEDHPNPGFRNCLEAISTSLYDGQALARCHEAHPLYFSPAVCHLIQQAEAHGDLVKTLSVIIETVNRGSLLARP